MKTIVIVAGIILAGATVIAVVQSDRKQETAPNVEQPAAVGQPATLPANPAPSAAVNPAHGVAGHRCDLPVGAPLSAPVASATPPVIQVNPQPAQPSQQAQPQPAKPASAGLKLNPEHGLPGHRCDLKVGAPLT